MWAGAELAVEHLEVGRPLVVVGGHLQCEGDVSLHAHSGGRVDDDGRRQIARARGGAGGTRHGRVGRGGGRHGDEGGWRCTVRVTVQEAGWTRGEGDPGAGLAAARCGSG